MKSHAAEHSADRARFRWWRTETRWPLPRLVAGFLLAPVLATLVVWAVAYVIAGFTEATNVGMRVVADNAALNYAYFVRWLVLAAVLPALLVLFLARQRGALAWAAAGAVAGGGVAGYLAYNQGNGMVPAVPIGAVSGLFLLLTTRWVAGVRNARKKR
ncbi:MAG: hypothetical protein AAFS07_13030 [Pseudomonadota bacterium]